MASEFGKGFAYPLGLFLAHEGRIKNDKKIYDSINSKSGSSMWFNAAADHLYELNIPDNFSKKKQKEIGAWVTKCLEFRHKDATWADVEQSLQYAKDLLRRWDVICGIPSAKGTWE